MFYSISCYVELVLLAEHCYGGNLFIIVVIICTIFFGITLLNKCNFIYSIITNTNEILPVKSRLRVLATIEKAKNGVLLIVIINFI